MRSASLHKILLAGLACLLWALPAWAVIEEEPKDERLILYSLKTEVKEDYGRMVLAFDYDFEQPLSMLYEKGLLRVILPKTKFVEEMKAKRINNGFIKEIRTQPMGQNSILEIYFADPAFDPEGKVQERAEFEKVEIFIYKKTLPHVATPTEEPQAEPTKFGSQFFASSDLEGDSTLSSIIQMLMALFVVLALLYGTLLLYNKLVVKKFNLNSQGYQIKMTSSIHLGPKQKVSIVEVNGMAFAVGITPNQINLIGRVDRPEILKQLKSKGKASEEGIDFAALRADYQKRQAAEAFKEQSPAESFKSELLRKIKRMKPID